MMTLTSTKGFEQCRKSKQKFHISPFRHLCGRKMAFQGNICYLIFSTQMKKCEYSGLNLSIMEIFKVLPRVEIVIFYQETT